MIILDEFARFLSKMLNQEVTPNMSISLSSAQRLKAHAWLVAANTHFNEKLLFKTFKVKNIFSPQEEVVTSSGEKNDDLTSFEMRKFDSLSIGIDIQCINELCGEELSDPKGDPLLRDIFTFREMSYAQAQQDVRQTLTGIFCAKEAIIKCGLVDSLDALEISHAKDGRPYYPGCILSISHSKDYAMAVALKYDDHTNQLVNHALYQNTMSANVANFASKRFRLFDKIVLILLGFNLLALALIVYRVSL